MLSWIEHDENSTTSRPELNGKEIGEPLAERNIHLLKF